MHSAGAPTLADNDVHLWYVATDKIGDARLLDRYREMLSAEETAQQQRFARQRDRHRYLVTRALVRTVLSRYASCDPREWVFQTNDYGKPSIARPAVPALHFNLSHTGDIVVCAVGRHEELGVDVESVQRRTRALKLARHFFAPAEVAVLERTGDEDLQATFFDFWTLKEAYIKARGKGLSIPLRQFAFDLAPDRAPVISMDRHCEDTPAGWQFIQLDLPGGYRVALAARLPSAAAFSLRLRETVPTVSDGDERILSGRPRGRWVV